jgi:hypothetical protein
MFIFCTSRSEHQWVSWRVLGLEFHRDLFLVKAGRRKVLDMLIAVIIFWNQSM